ncbi:MAG: sulfate ABC transporter permease subunit CysW [Bradyrhizobiaceae bacterium]|nr:MAG: sulfate ABC transporter permease subunit CysW [Bradyrhizobiaceae bacterium]
MTDVSTGTSRQTASSRQAEWMQAPVGGGPVTRPLVLGTVLLISLLFLVVPLVLIVVSAFASGAGVFLKNLTEPTMLHAIGLTLLVALLVVPVNILFGMAAAWTVTKYTFPGRTLLIALIELPYSISPIVAGVAYLFVYGSQGLFGPLLEELGIKIMFALPAIFLASLFVTAPFVARELIPLMQVQGTDEEEAAVTLGASGLQTFWRVTVPNVKWAVVYGAILCNARVMGEFGAVSVVSGNIRGQTTTLPLQIELLYQDYNVAGAFAAATVLTGVAFLTIIIKIAVERMERRTDETQQQG